MSRVKQLFTQKQHHILSVYFTAGFPKLDSTMEILTQLQVEGVDLVEVGIPFSDPLADGPVIQQSSEQALENGMNLKLLFGQLKEMREHISIPVFLMGYFNSLMQFGMDNFLNKCKETGVDGVIIPDLPLTEYEKHYENKFMEAGLANIFLVTPQTSEERLRLIDKKSDGFIYMVSSSSTTGEKNNISQNQLRYFERVQQMNLKNPRLIGFGISDHETFNTACNYANGAVIGSAFIRSLRSDGNSKAAIQQFVSSIRNQQVKTKQA